MQEILCWYDLFLIFSCGLLPTRPLAGPSIAFQEWKFVDPLTVKTKKHSRKPVKCYNRPLMNLKISSRSRPWFSRLWRSRMKKCFSSWSRLSSGSSLGGDRLKIFVKLFNKHNYYLIDSSFTVPSSTLTNKWARWWRIKSHNNEHAGANMSISVLYNDQKINFIWNV